MLCSVCCVLSCCSPPPTPISRRARSSGKEDAALDDVLAKVRAILAQLPREHRDRYGPALTQAEARQKLPNLALCSKTQARLYRVETLSSTKEKGTCAPPHACPGAREGRLRWRWRTRCDPPPPARSGAVGAVAGAGGGDASQRGPLGQPALPGPARGRRAAHAAPLPRAPPARPSLRPSGCSTAPPFCLHPVCAPQL